MAQGDLLDSMLWHVRSWDQLKSASWFTISNYVLFFLFILLIVLAIFQTNSKIKTETKRPKAKVIEAPGFPSIEETRDFDWKTTEPLKFRPFKPIFYLTMSLESLDPNDLILMDKNYHDRITYRRRILEKHHDTVVGVGTNARIGDAVREMYSFLFGTYLPKRYPTMFKVHEAIYETGRAYMTENLVTGEMHPAQPTKMTETITLLETLGKQLDEDFLLLLPEEIEKDPKYVLEAFITVCPSGFSPRQKLGKRLADIHGPVPSYGEKLESSMDRFFTKVEVGKYVKRVNWTMTTDAELYAAGDGSVHAHEGDEVEQLDNIDVDVTFLRCERQTLHRLPQSKALVFAFKTYLYNIKDVKEEGLGEELANAIDGLKNGNAPGMHFYKRGAVWGEAVKRYLRE